MGTNRTRFSTPSSELMPPATVSKGKSCLICQISTGASNTSATAAPAASHQLRSTARGPTVSTPTASPARNTGTSHLFAMPTPTAAPSASHQRPSPVRSSRNANSATTVHTRVSTVEVDSMCVETST